MPIATSKLTKHLSALLLFLLASIYLTYPLIFNLSTYAPGTVDELYITWILNWDIHSVTSNIFNLFNGNIYYPFGNSIAYSDLHLSSAFIGLLPVLISQEPLTAYTVNLLLSFALLGFSMYLLVYFLTDDYFASLTSGTIFGFSTYLLPKLGHLQVLTVYWIPLSLLSYFAFIKYGKVRFFILSLFFFYLQFINSFQPSYFLLFCLIGISILEMATKRRKLSFFINKKTLIPLIVVFLGSIPIIYPYYHTSITFNYIRDIRESIHTANRPEHFFLNFGRSHIGPFFNALFYKSPGPFLYDGYRGFINIILTFFVIGYAIFKRKSSLPRYFLFFVGTAIATYVISLGPAFQLGGKVIKDPFMIPLPYSLLYYFAPGFKGFRNSGRWEMFEILAFCIAIGLLLSFMLRKRKVLRIVFNLVFCILVIAEFTFPIKFFHTPSRASIPDVYNFLAQTKDSTVIAEFPIYNWNMSPYAADENTRLYYSTFHFRKTLNGGGGFSPQPWQEIVETLATEFPQDESIKTLKKLGVNYIIVHEKEFDKLNNEKYKIKDYSIPNSKMVKDMLSKNSSVKFIDTFDNKDSVFEIE